MGAKVSEAMLKARAMIEQGATAYRAAKDCGITQSAITKSRWWLERRGVEQRGERMQKARAMIEQGATAYQAAKMTGLSQSTISRADWYRDYMKGKNHA